VIGLVRRRAGLLAMCVEIAVRLYAAEGSPPTASLTQLRRLVVVRAGQQRLLLWTVPDLVDTQS